MSNWFDWFDFLPGSEASEYLDILRSARRRRVFTTSKRHMIERCETLKAEGLLKGGADKLSDTHNFRLTERGHQCLKP